MSDEELVTFYIRKPWSFDGKDYKAGKVRAPLAVKLAARTANIITAAPPAEEAPKRTAKAEGKQEG